MAFVLARAGTVCTRQKRGAYISPPLFFLKIIIITPFHKVPTEQPRAARPYNSEHSPEDKEERTQSIIFRPFGFSRFGVDVLAPCLVSGHNHVSHGRLLLGPHPLPVRFELLWRVEPHCSIHASKSGIGLSTQRSLNAR